MNKRLLIFLPFLLLLAGVFTSCEEVEEVGKYDNWRERNEAYIDSLNLIIGGRADRIIEGAKYEGDNGDSVKLSKIPVGELFAIKDNYKSTTENSFCIFIVRKYRQTIPMESVRFIRSQLRHTIMVQ